MNENELLKVLLIEDNHGDAFLIKFYLGESTTTKFEVAHTETIAHAFELLEQQTFDLLLVDMHLPDSLGIETIQKLLQKYPNNLLIVLTGLIDEQVGIETLKIGAQDFLVKGRFDGKVLISTVLFAFQRYRLNTQIRETQNESIIGSIRFEYLQQTLGIGYMEMSLDNQTIYASNYTRQTLCYGVKTCVTLQDYMDIIEDSEQFLEEHFKMLSTRQPMTFQTKHKKYGYGLRIECQIVENKIIAVIAIQK